MKENEFYLLENAKTIIECARIIKGINYTNGRVKKEIVDYCFKKYGIDIVSKIAENNKHFCRQCGEEIPGNRQFCNSSCAAKYNNSKRVLTEETKKKISQSLHEHYKLFVQKGGYGKGGHRKDYFETHTFICKTCGKEFFSKKSNIKFCSMKCVHSSEEYKNKIRKKALERVKNETFSGWKSRGVRSYPEKFWENVLNNNSISFIPEDFSTKKYFLDFLIEKNGKKIDLEIDGKQHERRKEHDKKRDDFLIENGFIVYRVKWNSINTEVGKTIMREKIDSFLEFYNEL